MPFLEENFQAVWQAAYGDRQIGHAHFWDRAMSRRAFLAAGAVATGAVLAPQMWMPVFAAEGFSPPNPIKGGTTIGPFGLQHFYFPGPNPFSTLTVESKKGDPSLIRDFNGFVGMGEWASGKVASSSLTWNADIRFMKGEFVGKDGEEHRGAFGFIWLDVFTGSGSQVHDFNPGNGMNGVFWTVRLPSDSVDVNLGDGRATMSVQNLHIPDFGTVVNALQGGSPTGHAVIGFHIKWSGVTERFQNRQESLPTPFAGIFVKNTATMQWTAVEAGHTMIGSPKSTSVTILGHERNGKFFPDEDHD